ncbi:MAG TPA: hypothetical protein VFK40_01765 [Nitrososphaeraceae archaeon]|nr:hypothetical protein [Nitrososphaeraceae archaeon]
MTKSNTSNSNINKDSASCLDIVNTKWAIEQRYFNETKPAPTTFYDLEKHRSRTEHRPWPRFKPVEQIGWEKFYTRILDPTTGKPYEQLDKKGREIEQPDGKGPVRHYVRMIIRFRDYNDKEYILTSGSAFGFSSLGETLSYHLHKPQMYTKTLFDSRRKFDDKTQSFSEVTTGILNAQEIYTLPWTEENLNSILEENIITKTTPQVYLDKIRVRGRIEISNPCNFVVKDYGGEAHAVEGETWEERLERFRKLSFNELYKWEYLKEKKKEDNNVNNNNSVNNTQHFK